MTRVKKSITAAKLREALFKTPEDKDLRLRAARAYLNEGDALESARLLMRRFVNLASHEVGRLPCLCKQCLDPSLASFEVDGDFYDRDFASAKGRILFYWVPRELKKRKSASNAIAAHMKKRL